LNREGRFNYIMSASKRVVRLKAWGGYERINAIKLSQKRSIVGWVSRQKFLLRKNFCLEKCFFCPPVGAGGQQKDVAHPTKKLNLMALIWEDSVRKMEDGRSPRR